MRLNLFLHLLFDFTKHLFISIRIIRFIGWFALMVKRLAFRKQLEIKMRYHRRRCSKIWLYNLVANRKDKGFKGYIKQSLTLSLSLYYWWNMHHSNGSDGNPLAFLDILVLSETKIRAFRLKLSNAWETHEVIVQ